MNFWPRDRLPFMPAMATPLQFQALAPHFNNPAWEIAQPIMANAAYFASGLDPNSPWIQQPSLPADNQSSTANSSRSGTSRSDDKGSGSSSPSRRDKRDRGRDRDDRSRDRNRRHRSRSRDRRSSKGGNRSRSSSREDDGNRRKRSPREKRRRSSDEDEPEKKKKEIEKKTTPKLEKPKEELPKPKPKPDPDNKYSLEAANYKYQTPNETIMIRGLAQHISENDLRQDIVECGLMPKDIRLIRKKETGVSRGFAFVEFNSTEEALCWMELKQGILMLQDIYRAIMQFSIVANDAPTGAAWPPTSDWDCPTCFAHNFKKRVTCFKCLALRPDSSHSFDPNCEISPHPTTKMVIRNLDALTTEEELLKEISAVSNISIQSCEISRDSLTNLSKCVCFIQVKNVLEAIKLFNELTATPLVIQNKKVSISYCKLESDKSSAVMAPMTMQMPNAAQQMGWAAEQQQYTLNDVPHLAEYSANMYAANATQKAAYLQYYTQFYTAQLSQMPKPDATDTNAAAAVAQTAIQMAQTKKAALTATAAPSVTTVAAPSIRPSYLSSQQLISNQSIGEPDVSSYVYDESSGYYFDQKTGLYYDATTQYFYHSQDQVYLYWDTERRCFQSVQADSRQQKPDETKEDKKKDKDKQQDKVKVAKRIAKDMERWAKTLNQKKEVARQGVMAVQQAQSAARSAPTADIAFAVLERKEAGLMSDIPIIYPEKEEENVLVASYGGGSDSDEAADESAEEANHIDWAKLACLLCKRQLPTKEALIKHQQLSDLHRQNLEAWYRERGIDPPSGGGFGSAGYRDRAKERRQKFGTPDAPKPNRLKEKYMKEQRALATTAYEEPTRAGIPSGNVGSKMLQKMGWSEGMGLGKTNQGRTDIVQAMQRVSSAGLGAAGSSLGPAGSANSSNSYKDHVKRVAMARFSELKD